MMDTCDVLVVGGGPAGSSCARELVRAGFDVLVLDKAGFPRDKVCAGWITPAVVGELEIDLGEYGRDRILQPITGFRTGLIGGCPVMTHYGWPVSYGIRRCEFDHFLLSRSGARLHLREPLADLRRDNDGWVANDRIHAAVVVGAGGHFCPVARRLASAADDAGSVVVAQEIEFQMSPDELAACRIEPEIPELYFCQDLKGYAWCFRKGDFLNVGLGREGEARLSAHVADFCDWLLRDRRIPPTIPTRFHGHAYRLYRGSPRRPAADGALLIGDAAGLAYPQSGEGIRPAVESGLLAAGVIIEANGDYRQNILAALERRITARFGRFRKAPASPPQAPSGWRQTIARRLLATRWFTRHFVINRWFLHAHQPPLPQMSPAAAPASRG